MRAVGMFVHSVCSLFSVCVRLCRNTNSSVLRLHHVSIQKCHRNVRFRSLVIRSKFCLSVPTWKGIEKYAVAIFYLFFFATFDLCLDIRCTYSVVKSTCCRSRPRRASLPGTSTGPSRLMTILRTPTAMDRILCTRSARWHSALISVLQIPLKSSDRLLSCPCLSVC